MSLPSTVTPDNNDKMSVNATVVEVLSTDASIAMATWNSLNLLATIFASFQTM